MRPWGWRAVIIICWDVVVFFVSWVCQINTVIALWEPPWYVNLYWQCFFIVLGCVELWSGGGAVWDGKYCTWGCGGVSGAFQPDTEWPKCWLLTEEASSLMLSSKPRWIWLRCLVNLPLLLNFWLQAGQGISNKADWRDHERTYLVPWVYCKGEDSNFEKIPW